MAVPGGLAGLASVSVSSAYPPGGGIDKLPTYSDQIPLVAPSAVALAWFPIRLCLQLVPAVFLAHSCSSTDPLENCTAGVSPVRYRFGCWASVVDTEATGPVRSEQSATVAGAREQVRLPPAHRLAPRLPRASSHLNPLTCPSRRGGVVPPPLLVAGGQGPGRRRRGQERGRRPGR